MGIVDCFRKVPLIQDVVPIYVTRWTRRADELRSIYTPGPERRCLAAIDNTEPGRESAIFGQRSPSPIRTTSIKHYYSRGPCSAKIESKPSPTAAALPASKSNSIASILEDSQRLQSQNQDNPVLHETLTVIDEHITDLHSAPNSSALNATTDSSSEYSSHVHDRLSYIQGEETDEEEEVPHTRAEVEAWSADQVAEYLFTAGVEKKHCEVFRDQEIAGEVLLGMDQSSLFLKAFDLGSVGRRLKTWQKIKGLQDEVNGHGVATRRNTQTFSDAGSEDSRGISSRRRKTIYISPFKAFIPNTQAGRHHFYQSHLRHAASGHSHRSSEETLGSFRPRPPPFAPPFID
ncbi:hypothetical protein DL765_008604 [Monosporascus sp. GIB2]|nr:hypothetical protein DL765_008604 [Monosporascus sp. GIB2]